VPGLVFLACVIAWTASTHAVAQPAVPVSDQQQQSVPTPTDRNKRQRLGNDPGGERYNPYDPYNRFHGADRERSGQDRIGRQPYGLDRYEPGRPGGRYDSRRY